jgi:hypothetical protein
MFFILSATLFRLSSLLVVCVELWFTGTSVCNKLHLEKISGIRFLPYSVRFDGEHTQWVS